MNLLALLLFVLSIASFLVAAFLRPERWAGWIPLGLALGFGALLAVFGPSLTK